MIEEYTLFKLCEKYNINSEKIVTKNNNILTYGEYIDIDNTLKYLINNLKISPANIEKCPSILYRNVFAIKDNIEFLKNAGIHFSNIESCLHVLSAEPNSLAETYNYVINNYESSSINRNTSILSVNKDIIMSVENLNLSIPKEGYLTLAVAIEWGSTTLEEIQKIIQSKEYKEHPELFTSQTLAYAKLEDIQALLKMDYWQDERFKGLLTSSVVAKAKSMLSKLPILINMAEKYNIDKYLNTSFLLFSPSQNYALINYLNDNNIPLIIEEKLNPIFGKQPGVLKKKYGIDIKELSVKYSLESDDFGNINGGKKL